MLNAIIILILTSVDNFAAGDTDGQAATMSPTTGFPRPCHSFFNKALRDALKDKKLSVLHINQHVLTSEGTPYVIIIVLCIILLHH